MYLYMCTSLLIECLYDVIHVGCHYDSWIVTTTQDRSAGECIEPKAKCMPLSSRVAPTRPGTA